MIPHGKDIDYPLFYAVCYAIRFETTKKLEKCCDDELETDWPNDLFSLLDVNETSLRLDLDYQNLKKQCFLLMIL